MMGTVGGGLCRREIGNSKARGETGLGLGLREDSGMSV